MKLTKIEKSRLEIWNFFIRSVHKYQTWIEKAKITLKCNLWCTCHEIRGRAPRN